MPIRTIAELQGHLALATKVELSTIPPYLYAMYSIKDQSSDAARLIASVVVEEMLHACLTTNLLLAIGGEPEFGEDVIPAYPEPLAHHQPELMLTLDRCATELIRDTFMTIERPQVAGAPPEDDNYETLGQFYAALELAIMELDETDLFSRCQSDRQLSDPSFYGPVKFDADDSGGLMLIDGRSSAVDAIEIIIHQGEGVADERWADPDHLELTHYYKFEQLADGSTPIGEVWPVLTNPRTADFPEALQGASDLFNALYRVMFVTMDNLFAPGANQGALIGQLYALMSDCLAPVACYLVSQPVGDSHNAGPTFETYRFDADPWGETYELAAAIANDHPALAGVVDSLERYRV